MSEKRFSETERNCYYTSLVFDNQTQEELGTNKSVKLLNAFYEENEQLKKECKIAIDEMVTDYKKLEKENEQLKKDVMELEKRDYYNQSERYKILGRAIELASDYIHTNNLEYYDFCGLVTEFEEELLEGKEE